MKHFEDHSAYNDDQERGFYTACGIWSPETRHRAATMVYPLPATKDQLSVTCRRCQRVLFKRKAETKDTLYHETMRDG